MKKFVITALATLSLSALAGLDKTMGEWGSGGGNALVCFQDTDVPAGQQPNEARFIEVIKANNNSIPDSLLKYISSIEVFDLYEAKKRRGIDSVAPEIVEIRDGEKIYEYLDRVGDRYKKSIPFMKGLIDEGKGMIPDSRIIFHSFAVEYQNDLGSVTLPGENCIISTIAAQVNYNDFYEVHIDERLFNHPKHSYQSKAILILHELLYAVGRKNFDQTDSGATRNIVRQLISYHPQITEFSVSKNLYDLGWYTKEYWTPASELMYSNIFEIILYETQGDAEFLSADLIGELKERGIYARFVREYEEEYGDAPFEAQKPTLADIKEVLKVCISTSSRPKFWRDLEASVEVAVQEWKNNVTEDVNEKVDGILSNLKEFSNVSSEDYSALELFLSELYLPYSSNVEYERFSLFMNSMTDIKKLAEKISNWTRFSVCSTTSASTDVSNPEPVHQEHECYGPLRLDNVIPKE